MKTASIVRRVQGLTVILLTLLFSVGAIAQQQQWGNGSYYMNPGCGYDPQPSDIDEDPVGSDPEVETANEDVKAAEKRHSEATRALSKVKSALMQKDRMLAIYMKDSKQFTSQLMTCAGNGDLSADYVANCDSTRKGEKITGEDGKTTYKNPFVNSTEGNFCPSSGGSSQYKSPALGENNVTQCRAWANNYVDAKNQFELANAELAAAKAQRDAAKIVARETRKSVRERLREEEEEAARNGEDPDEYSADNAGVRDCPTCRRSQARGPGFNKGVFWGNVGLGVLGAGLSYLSADTISKRNAKAGWPSQPYPTIGYALPYVFGGIYGGIAGGYAAGSNGCSPGVANQYAPGTQGGPFGANGNGGYGGQGGGGYGGYPGGGYGQGGGGYGPYGGSYGGPGGGGIYGGVGYNPYGGGGGMYGPGGGYGVPGWGGPYGGAGGTYMPGGGPWGPNGPGAMGGYPYLPVAGGFGLGGGMGGGMGGYPGGGMGGGMYGGIGYNPFGMGGYPGGGMGGYPGGGMGGGIGIGGGMGGYPGYGMGGYPGGGMGGYGGYPGGGMGGYPGYGGGGPFGGGGMGGYPGYGGGGMGMPGYGGTGMPGYGGYLGADYNAQMLAAQMQQMQALQRQYQVVGSAEYELHLAQIRLQQAYQGLYSLGQGGFGVGGGIYGGIYGGVGGGYPPPGSGGGPFGGQGTTPNQPTR